jgi:hypothetical protein
MTPAEFEAAILSRAAAAIAANIERCASAYDRKRDLGNLIGHRFLLMTQPEIIQALERAVGASSKAVASQAWHGDFNRLVSLRAALAAERRALNAK